MTTERYEIKVTGIVQGVGFRPFIYNLAKSLSLNGWVNNTSDGVVIDIEGDANAIRMFLEKLRNEAPPLSNIKDVSVSPKSAAGYKDFEIRQSTGSERQNIFISPDVAICDDCMRELLDRSNRRYLYPFINCTNCGPRFTIVRNVPYDRINTTMDKFGMCEKCSGEYNDPGNRRYHAQPISCYDCGPELELLDRHGEKVKTDNMVEYTKRLLLEDNIVAVKGLGGYHLVCNALSGDAVLKLRKRKIRDDKPFALMVKDCRTAMEYCSIREEEKKLLESKEKPIVLLQKRADSLLPDEIAPSNPYLGIMLPYTPLHALLFTPSQDDCSRLPGFKALVATSGNRSSEPIYYRDEEAYDNLGDIADYYLTNDREIYIRTDDSVTRTFRGSEYIIRRSRGYAPAPVTCDIAEKLGPSLLPSVLACGGELKNTFCLNKGKEFYLSHHIGDLENEETLSSFEEGIEHFKGIFNIEPDIAAYDLHPEYLSTKYAMALPSIETIAVQHHHAHIASCMAENGLYGDVIGVAFDGTGYGEDGNIWGGEFFTGSYAGFLRAGHLEYVKMPGGEAAIREPWRMAVSYLDRLYGKDPAKCDIMRFIKGVGKDKIGAVLSMMDKNINSPLTSSMGRLFDAVSALLGIRTEINYEGQAAVELEYSIKPGDYGAYGFKLTPCGTGFEVGVSEVIRGIVADVEADVPGGVISSKFHETAAEIILGGCSLIRGKTGLSRVALSGGVFLNMSLLEKTVTKLEGEGFEVFTHSRVPTNDGGISLGQAVIAIARKSS